MNEENQKLPEKTAPTEIFLEPALAHKKIPVIIIASLLASLFIYDTAIKQLEWSSFQSIGLAINAGVVYGFFLYFHPLVNITVGLILLLLTIVAGDIGYWLTGISVIVYFLIAYKPKRILDSQ